MPVGSHGKRRWSAIALVAAGAMLASLPIPVGSASGQAESAAIQPLPRRLSGKVINRAPTRRKVVALTIDCGANQAGIPSILATLRNAKVPATFFVTGQFARMFPRAVRKMAAGGHLVSNHSNTHPDFAKLSADSQAAQVRKAQRSIVARSGTSPRPWFRFPYGSSTSAAIRLVNRDGYAAVGWTVDTLGWLGTSGGQSAGSVKRRVLAAAEPGEIVLMHCGSNPNDRSTLDADALPSVIRGLSRRGYDFETLDDIMRWTAPDA